jgi:glyoxylase I family protein
MRINSIYHTGFVVRDIERSIRFYTEVLGLNLERAPSEASGEWISSVVGYDNVRLKLAFVGPGDGHSIELIQYIEPPGSPGPNTMERKDVGAAHAGMLVDDLLAWRSRLQEHGITFHSRPLLRDVAFPWARHAVYFQDPDGNWLELVERAPRPSGASGN